MKLLLKLSRSVSHPSTIWGNHWQVSLSLVYANWWTELISTRGSKTTNNREKGKLRLSLKKGWISGQTDTIITSWKGIMKINLGLPILRSSMQCSESQYIKYWRRLKMNHSSNDQIRWWETQKNVTITSITSIIRIMGILQRIAGVCGITWTSSSERAK